MPPKTDNPLFEVPSLPSNYTSVDTHWHSLNYSFCKYHVVLPIKKHQDTIWVAFENPFSLEAYNDLCFLLEARIERYICDKNRLIELIEKSFNLSSSKNQFLKHAVEPEPHLKAQKTSLNLLNNDDSLAPSIQLLNSIIQQAVVQKASDIHFEPDKTHLNIRYRIDGVLLKKQTIHQHMQAPILTRLKILANMDISEQRRPQDGRISLFMGNQPLDFRISTLPTVEGERIVLRILDAKNTRLSLDQLGFDLSIQKSFKQNLKRKEGLILVTGPTGSGKTTTLYSAIEHLYEPSLNVMTIEDPIEYQIEHIAQMAVHPKIGLTFSAGLKHILRQDPDVILIGEIRDKETAQIALQASLTGHLVLSTLHTNDAPSAINRLIDMGVEPFLLSSSLIAVLAQRLVRKNCPFCTQKVNKPTDATLCFDAFESLYQGRGCEKCFQTGYQGRIGLYEWMPITEPLKEPINQRISTHTLKKYAQEQGMLTLKEQAQKAVAKGLTSPGEMIRVISGL